MHRGYVKLWRKSLDGGWLKDHKLWALWSWCLIKASHKEIKILVGLQEVHLMPGDFVFGRKAASEELNISESGIYRRMEFLKTVGNLDIKPNNRFSIISIRNWSVYQEDEIVFEQQVNNNRTTSEQQPDTNKHNKHKKNEKNIIKKILFLDFVFLTQKEFEALVEQFGEEGANQRIDRLNVYLGSTGKRYKSHYFTILNWEKRSGGNGSGNKPHQPTSRKMVSVDDIRKEQRRIQNGSARQPQNSIEGE